MPQGEVPQGEVPQRDRPRAEPGDAGPAPLPRARAGHAAQPQAEPAGQTAAAAAETAGSAEATAAAGPGPAAGLPRPARRDDGAPDGSPPGTVSARRAFVLVASTLLLLMLMRASAMVHAGEGMPEGTTRDVVLAVARPLERITSAVGLDRPNRLLLAAFGHEEPSSPAAGESELATAADQLAQTSGPTPSGAPGPSPSAAEPTLAPLRQPTAADPLRVLVTGDSLTESLGPTVAATAPDTVRAETETRFGTGLVRPDFFDWAAHARSQLATFDPEAVVVAMGGNDGQGITMPDGRVLPAGSDEWLDEYRLRAMVVMSIWSDGGRRRVYWLGLPPARSATLDGYFRQMNRATSEAARLVPGVRFVDLSPVLSDNGAYSDYLTDARGRTVLARTRDGVHLTLDGARMAADEVLRALSADWRLGG